VQYRICKNWKNLLPMWAEKNISESDLYDPDDETDWADNMRELGFDGELFLVFG